LVSKDSTNESVEGEYLDWNLYASQIFL